MSNELKPCPFCGGKCDPKGWMNLDAEQGPECETCGATAGSVEAWNSRKEPIDDKLIDTALEIEPFDKFCSRQNLEGELEQLRKERDELIDEIEKEVVDSVSVLFKPHLTGVFEVIRSKLNQQDSTK